MEASYKTMYHVGDRLIIELNTQQIFEGDYSDGGRNRIDLVNVRQHNNSNKLGGVYSFYRNEITNIYKPESKFSNKQKSNVVLTDSNSIQLVEEEYNRLKQLCKSAIYLEQIDKTYFKAVENLNEAETVGVVSLGTDESSSDNLKLLIICTWKQIYIFDLINFKNRKLYPGLKDVLETEYITKVMHGGSSLVNMLYLNYNVHVQNIFDTQIVDLILVKSKTGTCPNTLTDISQCLVNYLNFPPSLLKEALSLSRKNWIERPLTDEKKVFASQLVIYLISLKEHMKKKLFCDVYKAIDNVHNFYCKLDNYEFSHMMRKNNITKEIDALIPILSSTLHLNDKCSDKGEKGESPT